MPQVFQELSWKGNEHRSSSRINIDFPERVKDVISLELWQPSATHLRQSTQEQPLQTGPRQGSITHLTGRSFNLSSDLPTDKTLISRDRFGMAYPKTNNVYS